MNQSILLFQLPVEWFCIAVMIPPTIKPDCTHLAIVCEQFCQLCVHKLVIAWPVSLLFWSTRSCSRSTHRIVLTSPVEVWIIKMQLYVVSFAGISQFFDNIPLERWTINRVISTGSSLIKRESVMVACCNGDILCTSSLDSFNPSICIELWRIEGFSQLRIFLVVDIPVSHNPFGCTHHWVESPM